MPLTEEQKIEIFNVVYTIENKFLLDLLFIIKGELPMREIFTFEDVEDACFRRLAGEKAGKKKYDTHFQIRNVERWVGVLIKKGLLKGKWMGIYFTMSGLRICTFIDACYETDDHLLDRLIKLLPKERELTVKTHKEVVQKFFNRITKSQLKKLEHIYSVWKERCKEL